MNRHQLIRGSLDLLSLTRATRWLPRPDEVSGFAITLHHVRPKQPAAFDPNGLLSITPDFLDTLLGHLKQRGWRFVSVHELVADMGRAREPCRIAVTLDDGYRNNLQHALPVFRKHSVPFTIYVCPGFTDRTSELWWEALERMLATSDTFAPPDDPPVAPAETRTPDQKFAMFEKWRIWLTTVADEKRQRRVIRALAEYHNIDLAALAQELVMDWHETRAIAADPLCTIGAHTMTHAALARLAEKEAEQEIQASIERIADEIGSRPTSIAFPYGYPSAAGPREADLAKRAGLAASFTTQPGFVTVGGPRHGLPRVSVNGLFQKVRYMDVLLTPGLWQLRDRLKKLR